MRKGFSGIPKRAGRRRILDGAMFGDDKQDSTAVDQRTAASFRNFESVTTLVIQLLTAHGRCFYRGFSPT